MVRFKARKLRNGLFEIVGLDRFIDRKLTQLRRAFAGKSTKLRRRRFAGAAIEGPLGQLAKAMARHPRRRHLLSAGREKDQLLRSLVPLYVARSLSIEIDSGLISRFWKLYGVRYATPNAAKALREHVGYARVTKDGGREITPTGIKYVEEELLRLRAA